MLVVSEMSPETLSGCVSFHQLIIGGIMLHFGITYQDDCENGATDYLVTGGAIIIATNIIPCIVAIVFAISDDFSKSESFVIKTFKRIRVVFSLVSLVVFIWVKILHFLVTRVSQDQSYSVISLKWTGQNHTRKLSQIHQNNIADCHTCFQNRNFDIFQGSVVVFGAHSDWTYDAKDKGSSNYCAKPPFDCAFVLLIINWVINSQRLEDMQVG